MQSSPLLSLLLPLILSFFLWYSYRLKHCYIIMGSITCCDLEDPPRISGCRIGPAFLPFALNVWTQILLVISAPWKKITE